VAGSTRLRAGTEQKLVLNRIVTLAIVGLGHVYGKLMIGVRPDKQKLRERQRRILVAASGCSDDDAESALSATAYYAREALVLLLTGCNHVAAGLAVGEAKGDVRRAIRAIGLKAQKGSRRGGNA
jgi:N-acetylmuramic acid 6-phosphate etherase